MEIFFGFALVVLVHVVQLMLDEVEQHSVEFVSPGQ